MKKKIISILICGLLAVECIGCNNYTEEQKGVIQTMENIEKILDDNMDATDKALYQISQEITAEYKKNDTLNTIANTKVNKVDETSSEYKALHSIFDIESNMSKTKFDKAILEEQKENIKKIIEQYKEDIDK